MNFDGTTDDALGQRFVVFKIVHRVLRVLCVFVSSVFKQTRRLRSCMTSSRAVGRCVRHRGHRDTEDTEEFRDFASTTLPTTDGRICCLAIAAGAPRSARPFRLHPLRGREFFAATLTHSVMNLQAGSLMCRGPPDNFRSSNPVAGEKMQTQPGIRSWDTRRADKRRRLTQAAAFADGRVVSTTHIVPFLEALIAPGDRVVLEGNNQKQADFLSRSLAQVDPARVSGLHMILPSVSRVEHLDLFERGIARKLDFSYAGAQSLRISQFLEDGQLEIGA